MSTYSTDLKIEEIGTGEQAGTWGTTTNSNFQNVFEQAIVGRVTVPFTDANVTLTATNSVASQSFRNVYLNCTGTNTASRNLVVPTINKNYVVQNNTTGGFTVVVKTASGTGITIPNGSTCTVYADGTNVIQAFDYLPTLTVPTLNITTLDATNIEVTNIKAKDGTASATIADSTGVMTLASSVLTTTDINGGTVDNTAIGATTPSTGVFTQVDITAQGDLRLQDTSGGEYVALQAPTTLASSYTLTMPVDDGTSGQALITDGSGNLSWSTAASGDVYGPASATDNAIARFDGTTGKIIQNSVVTIADTTGNMAGVGTISSGAITSSSLTSGRVTYAGTAGLLQDSANLTFNGTTLAAAGFSGPLTGAVTGNASTATALQTSRTIFGQSFDGTANVTGSITSSSLTSGRVTYAGTAGLLQDDADLTFDGSTLTTLNSAYTGTLTGGTGIVNLGSGQFYKDASGNVGIGVAPSGWSSFSAIQLGGSTYNAVASSNGYMGVFANTYYDGSNFKYVSTAGASTYTQNGGAHYWSVATSGTAGSNITFSTGMTLDANSNLIIGSGSSANGRLVLGKPSGDGSVSVSGDGSNYAVFRAQGGGEFQLGSTSSVPVKLITNSIVRMTLNTTGTVSLQGGSTSSTGVGITFPATQSASSDANTLDDYEEGTFTPSLSGTSTAGTVTWSAGGQTGRYTKIGNVCKFQIWVSWTNWTGPTGSSVFVTGLPFTTKPGTNNYTAVNIYMDTGYTLTANNLLQAYIIQGTTNIFLSQYPVGGGNAAGIGFDTAAALMISGTYEADQ